MSSSATKFLQAALATVMAAACLLVSDRAAMMQDGRLVAAAEARIGRPLTPVSYAGVARRTTRRVAVAAPVMAAPVAVAAAARCVQAVDPYGRLYTRCY